MARTQLRAWGGSRAPGPPQRPPLHSPHGTPGTGRSAGPCPLTCHHLEGGEVDVVLSHLLEQLICGGDTGAAWVPAAPPDPTQPPASPTRGVPPRHGRCSPTLCPVLLEVSKSSAFTSETRSGVSAAGRAPGAGLPPAPPSAVPAGRDPGHGPAELPAQLAAAPARGSGRAVLGEAPGRAGAVPPCGEPWYRHQGMGQGSGGGSPGPYRQRSPEHRGNRPLVSGGRPPAGRSWCRTGRSGSPGAIGGVGGGER